MADRPEIPMVGQDGSETTVSTPAAFNNLVYGQGFKPRDGTIEDAYARLVEAAAAPPAQA